MPSEAEVVSYCRLCAAACGIRVTVDGERVVRVRGDADHPVSRGYTCPKGRGLTEWHHSPRRLDRPRLRGVEVGWDELLDDLAGRLVAIRDEAGPDAVGAYLATGIAYDAGGQIAAGSFLHALGSSSMYSATTVDNAPVVVAAELVAGNGALRPVWDPERPGLLLLVGTNPVVSHGYGTALPDPVTRLRRYRAGGNRIWVVDPRRTESAALADEHLAVRPGSDVTILAAIVAALLADGADLDEITTYCRAEEIEALRSALAPFTVDRAAAAADVPASAIARLVADVRANVGRVAVLVGTGCTMSTDGVVVEWLRWLVLILTGSLDRPGGMPFHHSAAGRLRPRRPSATPRPAPPGPASRPELPRVAREMPAVALADEIEAGHLQALVVVGGNPIAAVPDPDRTRDALRRLAVLAVVDVADGEMTELATHVLPATGQLERADVTIFTMAVPSRAQATGPVVAPVAERRPMWWSLGSLAHRMGVDLLRGADPDQLTEEGYLRAALAHSDTVDVDDLLEAGPHGIAVPVEHGWVHEMLPEGRWRLTPDGLLARLEAHRDPTEALVLAPRREMGWVNSVRYGGPESPPLVRLHPDDADRAGLASGGPAAVRSAHGSLTATVAVDDKVRPGVVSITHGRRGHSPGELTSSVDGVDPLTAMPQASGVPVTVEPGISSRRAPPRGSPGG
jgi:anaerobic selenocysteine-containing dehydrogenase